MIFNANNDTFYKVILDKKDLENIHISPIKFLSNSKATKECLYKILDIFNLKDEISKIDILTYNFEVFYIKIFLHKKSTH